MITMVMLRRRRRRRERVAEEEEEEEAEQEMTTNFKVMTTVPTPTMTTTTTTMTMMMMMMMMMMICRTVDDVDLFAAGIVERLVPGGLVGPTFGCIIGRQFRNTRVGDRFWHERRDPVVGLTYGRIIG